MDVSRANDRPLPAIELHWRPLPEPPHLIYSDPDWAPLPPIERAYIDAVWLLNLAVAELQRERELQLAARRQRVTAASAKRDNARARYAQIVATYQRHLADANGRIMVAVNRTAAEHRVSKDTVCRARKAL